MEPNDTSNTNKDDSNNKDSGGGLPPIAPTPAKPRTKGQSKSTTDTTSANANVNAGESVNNGSSTLSTPTPTETPYISPPGIRTRSGRKIKPTPPPKKSRTTRSASPVPATPTPASTSLKRRREEEDDDDDGGESLADNVNGVDSGANGNEGSGSVEDKRKTKKAKIAKSADADADADSVDVDKTVDTTPTDSDAINVSDKAVTAENADVAPVATDGDGDATSMEVDKKDDGDVIMEETEAVHVTAAAQAANNVSTTVGTAASATAEEASRPSITNINLRLPSQQTPAKSAANSVLTATTTTAATIPSTTSTAPADEIQGDTTNTRIRNFFTPVPKKTLSELKTLSPPVSFQLNSNNDNNNSNISNNNNTTDQLEGGEKLGPNSPPVSGGNNSGGRENGLFHYYFKRAYDRLTPIPVQFNNGRNNIEGVHRPEPHRPGTSTLQQNQQQDQKDEDDQQQQSGKQGKEHGVDGEGQGNNNNNDNGHGNVVDGVSNGVGILQGAHEVVEEEEEGDDIDYDQDKDEITSSLLTLSPFHKIYVWIVLVHVICAMIGGLNSNTNTGGGGVLSKLFLAPFMVIPNAAKYQYYHFYKFGIDDPEIKALDEPLAKGIGSVDTEKEEIVKEEEEYEEEIEEVQEPDPEPITKIEEEVVEEIVYVDNVELEERERNLIRQRKMIQHYKEEQEREKEKEEYLKKQEEYIMEQEENVQKSIAALQRQWKAYQSKKSGAEDLKNQLISLGRSLDASVEIIQETGDLLSQSKNTMSSLMSMDPNDSAWSSLVKEFSNSMRTLYRSSMLDIDLEDLDLFSFGNSIAIPGEGCKGKSHIVLKPTKGTATEKVKKKRTTVKKKEKTLPPLLDRDEFNQAKEKLINETNVFLREITKSSKLTKVAIDWFTSVAEDDIETTVAQRSPDSETITIANIDNLVQEEVPSPGISQKDVQIIIDGLLEVEMADTTGKFDYASVGNGAKVIRSGSRKTSSSLVENLPFINRFLSRASIKFYGHGAEAALLPTFPKTALGQCWSFEEEGARKQLVIKEMIEEEEVQSMEMDPDRGEYATLSISLSKPIHVDSIVIEHPSKLLSPSSKGSAIRKFRLIGFMDKEARGNPWLLGSFEYQIGKFFLSFSINN